MIDKEGKIVYIEQGNTAIDPTGAETACSRAATNNRHELPLYPGAISVISSASIAPHLPQTRPPSSVMVDGGRIAFGALGGGVGGIGQRVRRDHTG